MHEEDVLWLEVSVYNRGVERVHVVDCLEQLEDQGGGLVFLIKPFALQSLEEMALVREVQYEVDVLLLLEVGMVPYDVLMSQGFQDVNLVQQLFGHFILDQHFFGEDFHSVVLACLLAFNRDHFTVAAIAYGFDKVEVCEGDTAVEVFEAH